MQKMYFTSDPHFYHKDILKYCDRPVGDKTNEQWLYDQIAEIPKGSTLCILGDLCFRGNKLYEVLEFIIVHCGLKLMLIIGNHDDKNELKRMISKVKSTYPQTFIEPHLADYYEISKGQLKTFLGEDYKQQLGIEADKIVLFHFPIEEWNKCHHGSLHFHGHSHGNSNDNTIVNRIDVGIDSIGKIMTLEEVILALKGQNKTAKREPKHH